MSSIDAWDTGLRANFSSFLTWITIGRNAFSDEHWRPMVKNCNPCSVNYDLIGHLETLNDDLEVRMTHKVWDQRSRRLTLAISDFIWRVEPKNWPKRTGYWIEKCKWSFNNWFKLPFNRIIFEISHTTLILKAIKREKIRKYKTEAFMNDLTLEIRLKLLRLVWI